MSSTANDETLLTLLTVARESDEERKKILTILDLEPTRRKRAVNILVTEMRRNHASEAFVAVWDSLQEDSIAEAAKSVIRDNHLDGRTKSVTSTIGLFVLLAGILVGFGVVFIWILTDPLRVQGP